MLRRKLKPFGRKQVQILLKNCAFCQQSSQSGHKQAYFFANFKSLPIATSDRLANDCLVVCALFFTLEKLRSKRIRRYLQRIPITSPRGFATMSHNPIAASLHARPVKLTAWIVSGVFALFSALSLAQAPVAQPLAKQGSCPSGYHSSGNYCTPSSSSARAALPHVGSCPSGYHTSGGYCLASSNSSKAAIVKSGSCPSGYHTSGAYCLRN